MKWNNDAMLVIVFVQLSYDEGIFSHGHRKGDEHPTSALYGVWSSFVYFHSVGRMRILN